MLACCSRLRRLRNSGWARGPNLICGSVRARKSYTLMDADLMRSWPFRGWEPQPRMFATNIRFGTSFGRLCVCWNKVGSSLERVGLQILIQVFFVTFYPCVPDRCKSSLAHVLTTCPMSNSPTWRQFRLNDKP